MSKLIPHNSKKKISIKDINDFVKIGDTSRSAVASRAAFLKKEFVASRLKKTTKGCGGCSRRKKSQPPS